LSAVFLSQYTYFRVGFFERKKAVLRAFYSDHFVLPLPAGHRFPMAKYRMIREGAANAVPDLEFHEAVAASDGVLALAHHPKYVELVSRGQLSDRAQKEIGFPWSPEMVERSRRSAGATIAACRSAIEQGISVNLAGGTHHAYADHGAGFCVFNDAAVASRLMQAERRVSRVAIVDLDVHQGNGTASILADDDSVFTLSLHGERNYPFEKEQSDLDVALPDGVTDVEYLSALQGALSQLMGRFDPQLIIYLAGADPHEGDRLGRMKLSLAGLAERDKLVFELGRQQKIPIAVTMAGGYGKNIEDTVAVHIQTITLASRYAADWR
jgi:acetoin utilization deacetylase AcuC-like enzyme